MRLRIFAAALAVSLFSTGIASADFRPQIKGLDYFENATTNVNIDGGTIDGTTIGSSSAADATFTAVTVTGQIIQTNVGGSTPRNAWIQRSSIAQNAGSAFSMYQGSLYTDQTANLVDQVAFLDVDGDFGAGFHVNLTSNANGAWGLILGAHGTLQRGLLIDVDGSTANGITVYNNGTSTTGAVQLRANQDYATDGGAGAATSQNFTGKVLETYNVGSLTSSIDYQGNYTVTTVTSTGGTTQSTIGEGLIVNNLAEGDSDDNLQVKGDTDNNLFTTNAATNSVGVRASTLEAGNFTVSTNITTSGTLVSTNTGSFGWSVKTGANTACTATCTHAAVAGWDTAAGEVLVTTSDATADKCLCAGPN